MKFALLQCECITAHSLTWCERVSLQLRAVVFYLNGGIALTRRGKEKMQWGHWRWGASAASSDRANEAICNGILCSVRLQKGCQWPNKLSAAGLRPAHHCTILYVSVSNMISLDQL